MADKIPSDVRTLALSLHTDMVTLNAYASNPAMVSTLTGRAIDFDMSEAPPPPAAPAVPVPSFEL